MQITENQTDSSQNKKYALKVNKPGFRHSLTQVPMRSPGSKIWLCFCHDGSISNSHCSPPLSPSSFRHTSYHPRLSLPVGSSIAWDQLEHTPTPMTRYWNSYLDLCLGQVLHPEHLKNVTYNGGGAVLQKQNWCAVIKSKGKTCQRQKLQVSHAHTVTIKAPFKISCC